MERLQRRASGAWFLNFTNPSGLIVEALHREGHEHVVGLCDAPSGLKGDLCRHLGVDEDDVSLAYQGLNHLGWIQSVRIEGVETLPALLEGAPELCQGVHTLGFFGPELIQELGLLPNEYLYYFYFRKTALERELSLARTRGEMVRDWNDRLYREVGGAMALGDAQAALARYREVIAARRNSYMAEVTRTDHDRGITAETIFTEEGYEGLALRVMTALAGLGDQELHLNVPSRGTTDVLMPEEVGELTCDVDEHGAHPRVAQPLPFGPRGLVRQVKDYERLTVQAALHGDREVALQAAMAHPLIGDRQVAAACLDELLAAHRANLPQFQGS
jgi:6-phospho-beta-glucosidase